MTITSEVQKTGNLPGNSTTFTFSFSPLIIYTSTDIEVYLTVTATGVETLLAEGTGSSNYSVTVASFPGTGTITYPADEGTAIASTSTITIKKRLPLEQQTDLQNQGTYFPEVLEQQFDKIVGMIIQQQEEIDRCIKIPISEATITNTELNTGALRSASHHLLVDSTGTTFSTAALSSGTAATASDSTPTDVSATAAASGSSADFSRQDHRHLLSTTIPRLASANIWTETQTFQFQNSLASASDLDAAAQAGNFFDVTGTTTINTIKTMGIGTIIWLQFDGALTLTASTADLVLPGGEDIITVAGDIAVFYEYASADWRLISYMPNIPVYVQKSVDLSQKVTFMDDFLGTISTPISSTAGTGGQNEVATISAGDGGRITMKTDDDIDVDTHAAVCTVLTLDTLDWSADQGGLIMETRLQIDDVSEAVVFVGFTDVISTTVELPIYKTTGADTIDSDATNACGIGYDIDGTTDQFFHGGVKANTDTAATHSGSAPSDGTNVTLRVEVSSAGSVEGFINGTSIGTATANAITNTTAITPCIVIGNRTANQVIVTVDYLWAQANR